MPNPAQLLRHSGEARWAAAGTAAAAGAAGGAVVEHKADGKESQNRGRKTRAGLLGAAAGQAAYQAPAYGYQHYQDKRTPDWAKHGVKQSELPPEQKKMRRQRVKEQIAWKTEAKARGYNNAQAHRMYPAHWEHARANRALGWTHAGRTGQALGAAATLSGGLIAAHHAAGKDVEKMATPKFVEGYRHGYAMRSGMRTGLGMALGSATSTPARAALTGAGGSTAATALIARERQNRRLRRNHLEKRAGTATVGKRMSGGSFTSGPSTVVIGQGKRRERTNQLGKWGSGSLGHGSRQSEPPAALERYSKRHDNSGDLPSIPRTALTAAFPVAHGAIAGKKGKKLRTMGREAEGFVLAPLGGIHAAIGNERQGRYKSDRFESMSKAAMFTPTSVLTRSKPMDPSLAPPSAAGASAPGTGSAGSLRPGMLIPAAAAGKNGTPAQALGGAKSGPVNAAGKVKPTVATGAVGSASGVGKRDWLEGDDPEHERIGAGGTYADAKAAKHRPLAGGYHPPARTNPGPNRRYDAEAARQRRLGAATAVSGAGGAVALQRGYKHIRAASAGADRAMIDARGGRLIATGVGGLGAAGALRRYYNHPANQRRT